MDKYVVAHFMVGNTYPYSLNDWSEDIVLAQQSNIDGFSLNIGKDEWQIERIKGCFEAVGRLGYNFKFFISFDMSFFRTAADVTTMQNVVETFALHPNYLRIQDKAVISTFAGENSLFGYNDLNTAWTHVKEKFDEITPVYLIPSFFIEPARYRDITTVDGIFNWNGCWPTHLTPESTEKEIHNTRLESDYEYINVCNSYGKDFMASVSPWFFTHYGQDSWNKNWIYRGDDWLFVRRWKQLIAMRDHIKIVQIISWNDYGESHYIGPIKGAQPNSEAWVNGFDHQAWLHLSSYFVSTFKSGISPSISEDRIYVWARPHPKAAIAPETVPKPKNWQLTDDKFWVVVLTIAPSIVELSSSNELPSQYKVKAGMTQLQHSLRENGGIKVRIVRTGSTALEFTPSEYCFQSAPPIYNFNAFVSMHPSR